MSNRVTIVVELAELARTIADAFARSLVARGLTIAGESIDSYTTKLSEEELGGAFIEAGRNAAAALMLYEEDPDDGACDSVIGLPDGTTRRCGRLRGHGGQCRADDAIEQCNADDAEDDELDDNNHTCDDECRSRGCSR